MTAEMIIYAYVSDLDRLRQFYEGALGAKASQKSRNWFTFQLDEATFALHRQRSTEAARDIGYFHFEFRVRDIEDALTRFQAHGAEVVRGVSDVVYGKSAVLRDPDGREFRLMQETA
ncbi:MAG: VOC family protein [Chloroflexi bacterium]|nr:VOC family protein [Chloroflexota bacterium]